YSKDDSCCSGWDVADGWYLDELVLQTGPEQELFAQGPEGFEGVNEWDRWQVTHGTWEIATNGGYQGRRMAATVASGNYDDWQHSRLISPSFTMPASDQNPRLRFWHYYNFSAGDYGEVQVQIEGSNTWAALPGAHWEWETSGGVWARPSLDLKTY